MARNRRQLASMRFSIGRGCFLLSAGVLCVAFSVIKIIVGSEYWNKCPSREMIPVYIIVSGCLPVLLSALRQPYDSGLDSGLEMEKDRWSIKVTVLGVMVNLAWLVAGTYLVISIWSGNICSPSPLIITATGPVSPENTTISTVNETFRSDILHNNEHFMNYKSSMNDYIAKKDVNKTLTGLNKTETWNTDSNKNAKSTLILAPPPHHSVQASSSEDETMGSQNVKHVSETATQGEGEEMTRKIEYQHSNEENVNDVQNVFRNMQNTMAVQISDTATQGEEMTSKREDEHSYKENVNDVQNEFRRKQNSMLYDIASKDSVLISEVGREAKLDGNNLIKMILKTKTFPDHARAISDIAKTASRDKPCITCDRHILRFSLAVIVIDWLFVIAGSVYFCNFVYRRFSSIKSEIMLINT